MKLLVVLLSLFLAGCWGSEFSAPPLEESLEASATGESGAAGASTTAGASGSTGSSASSSEGSGGATGGSSTTGDGGGDSVGPTTTDSSSSATTGVATTTGAGGNGAGGTGSATTTGDSCREPDVAEPMRSFTWQSHSAETSRLCPQETNGVLYCGSLDGEPCMELKFQITAMEWEPLLWRLTFEEIEEPQPLTMTQQCASLEQPCNYQVAVPWTFVYMLQLVETDTGYAVKAFYLLGDDPAQHGVRHAINGEFAPDTQEYCGSNNPNNFVGDLWKEYVAYVRSLTWDC